MPSLERLQRSQLGTLDAFAKGGQARIYMAADLVLAGEQGPFVFKEYKDKRISISGLDGVAALRHRLSDDDRAVLDVLANWPVRVVERADGGADGVIIPLIPDDFFYELRLPSGTRKRRPRDGEYLPQPPARCRLVDVPVLGLGDRYRFCRDLAFAIGFLHKRSICVGDISFANVTYAPRLDPCVYLVDCDAARLSGQAPVVPQLHTPDWVPPEGARVQTTRTDLYKLGLFILRALTPRALSAQNRDPSWADSALDARGRYLLRRALDRDPGKRTSAREWYAHFNALLRTGRLPTTRHRSRMPSRPVTIGS
jgi:hypothetical protein